MRNSKFPLKRLVFSAACAMSLFAFAHQEKVIKIFSDGHIISEYKASDIDYIQIDDFIESPREVTTSVSGASITINWSAIDNATYSVYRSADNINFSMLANDISELSYTDYSPLPGANYYRVTATINGVESGYSSAVAAALPDMDLQSGVYLGIYGFNHTLLNHPISPLNESTINIVDYFIDGLSTKNGSILYYSVDQALNDIQSTQFPSDVSSVSIVTFTTGFDQGSLLKDNQYQVPSDYLKAINKRITTQTVNGQNIQAYCIGLRKSEITDSQIFKENLQNLASSPNNAVEVSDMSEVNNTFQEIAKKLSDSKYVQTLNLKTPCLADGALVRFTFDAVDAGEKSNRYIEGRFNLKNKSLDDIMYVGLKSTSGTTVKGRINDIFVTFTFEGVQTDDYKTIYSNTINEWTFIPHNSTWQINSEFEKEETIATMEGSTVIMLVLDCSNSISDNFTALQSNAKKFLETVAGNSGLERPTEYDKQYPVHPNKWCVRCTSDLYQDIWSYGWSNEPDSISFDLEISAPVWLTEESTVLLRQLSGDEFDIEWEKNKNKHSFANPLRYSAKNYSAWAQSVLIDTDNNESNAQDGMLVTLGGEKGLKKTIRIVIPKSSFPSYFSFRSASKAPYYVLGLRLYENQSVKASDIDNTPVFMANSFLTPCFGIDGFNYNLMSYGEDSEHCTIPGDYQQNLYTHEIPMHFYGENLKGINVGINIVPEDESQNNFSLESNSIYLPADTYSFTVPVKCSSLPNGNSCQADKATLIFSVTEVGEGTPQNISEAFQEIESSVKFSVNRIPSNHIKINPQKVSSNDCEPTEGSIASLFDNNEYSFFHSGWTQAFERSEPYGSYLDIEFDELVQSISFEMLTRASGAMAYPKKIDLYWSNDKQNWEKFATTTVYGEYKAGELIHVNNSQSPDGLFSAPEKFRYLRFCVMKNNKGQNLCQTDHNIYWNLAELHIINGDYWSEYLKINPNKVKSNDCETQEGSIAGLFDDDLQTYFHSSYTSIFKKPEPYCSYLDIEFDEYVSGVKLEMIVRESIFHCYPNEVDLYWSNDAENWNKLASIKDIPTDKTGGESIYLKNEESSDGFFKSPEQFKYLRFCVIKNSYGVNLSDIYNSHAYWHLAELHIWGKP